jgi:hypothetical protein
LREGSVDALGVRHLVSHGLALVEGSSRELRRIEIVVWSSGDHCLVSVWDGIFLEDESHRKSVIDRLAHWLDEKDRSPASSPALVHRDGRQGGGIGSVVRKSLQRHVPEVQFSVR